MTLYSANNTFPDTKEVGSNYHWYAIYTRSHYERKTVEDLQKAGFIAWVPVIQTMRQWSDRKKKIEVPLFNSYIFAYTSPDKLPKILSTQGAVYIVSFGGKPATIPNNQIEYLRQLLVSSEKYEISNEKFTSGEEVIVTQGILRGMHGKFIQYKGTKRIMLHIEAISQTILIEINPSFVKSAATEHVSL